MTKSRLSPSPVILVRLAVDDMQLHQTARLPPNPLKLTAPPNAAQPTAIFVFQAMPQQSVQNTTPLEASQAPNLAQAPEAAEAPETPKIYEVSEFEALKKRIAQLMRGLYNLSAPRTIPPPAPQIKTTKEADQEIAHQKFINPLFTALKQPVVLNFYQQLGKAVRVNPNTAATTMYMVHGQDLQDAFNHLNQALTSLVSNQQNDVKNTAHKKPKNKKANKNLYDRTYGNDIKNYSFEEVEQRKVDFNQALAALKKDSIASNKLLADFNAWARHEKIYKTDNKLAVNSWGAHLFYHLLRHTLFSDAFSNHAFFGHASHTNHTSHSNSDDYKTANQSFESQNTDANINTNIHGDGDGDSVYFSVNGSLENQQNPQNQKLAQVFEFSPQQIGNFNDLLLKIFAYLG